jgi:hypothetical protein
MRKKPNRSRRSHIKRNAHDRASASTLLPSTPLSLLVSDFLFTFPVSGRSVVPGFVLFVLLAVAPCLKRTRHGCRCLSRLDASVQVHPFSRHGSLQGEGLGRQVRYTCLFV